MIETHDDAVTQAAMIAVLEFQLADLQDRYRRLQQQVAQAVHRLGIAVLEQDQDH